MPRSPNGPDSLELRYIAERFDGLNFDGAPVAAFALRLPLGLNVSVAGSASQTRDRLFRVDSASDFSQLPPRFLVEDGIAIPKKLPSLRLHGASAGGFLRVPVVRVRFEFCRLPNREFRSLFALNPKLDKFGLLAFRDVARYFRISSPQPRNPLVVPGPLRLSLDPNLLAAHPGDW
jgi:hypothetical protein